MAKLKKLRKKYYEQKQRKNQCEGHHNNCNFIRYFVSNFCSSGYTTIGKRLWAFILLGISALVWGSIYMFLYTKVNKNGLCLTIGTLMALANLIN